MTGRKRHREREVFDTAAAAKRFVRATGRHVAAKDVDNLALLVELRDVVDEALAQAVMQLHDQHDYSWGRIAQALGTSRQAVQQRFGSSSSTAANVEVEGQGCLL